MKRRELLRIAAGLPLLRAVGRTGGQADGTLLSTRPAVRLSAQLLVPMDDVQTNHLKAYGIAYHAIERSGRCEWLLNYRGGSFLLPDDQPARHAAALAGVVLEPVGDGAVATIKGEIAQQNMDAIPLERVPRVAIYSP